MKPSSRQLNSLLALLVGLLALPAQAESPPAERIEWTRAPINIELKVDAETQVQFPAPVKVGMPSSVKAELRIQSVGDMVYLKPSAAFDATRLVIQTRDGGHTYLLDVAASDTAEARKALRIIDAGAQESADEVSAVSQPSAVTAADPVVLTRFAARQLYAPTRLVDHTPGIVREAVSEGSVPLLRGGAVSAHPVIAWRSGRLHVTAVKLINASPVAIELDPRDLRGEWLAATFQHNRLLRAGDEADTTVVYLVSERPFALSL